MLKVGWGWAACAMMALAGTGLRAEEPICPPSHVPPLALAHVREAVARNQEVTIVAFGSSSTAGYHSTNIGHSYPAVLQAALAEALPGSHIAVLNRGIGGQDVVEELPRLERDALTMRPTLVIWQLGANSAIRRIDPELFKRLVLGGVHRMQGAHVDVVLMDNQRAPAILASPAHLQIDQVLADVAVATGAGLFARGTLMDQWRQAGSPYERFVSEDGLHHNDLGYHCIAKSLAAAIVEGLGRTSTADATAPGHGR